MRNLNLPDHTPAPETLAFAHELEAANTAQTRRELLAEVTRLEAENTALRQQVDALTGERDAANEVIRAIYAGEHGCIPHPSDCYKQGIWVIARPNKNIGRMEWLMTEEDLQRLKDNQLPF